MKTAATLLSLSASAAAFSPFASNCRSGTVAVRETKGDLQTLAGELNPNIGFYDPLMLSDYGFWGDTNEATIGFLRHSEIK